MLLEIKRLDSGYGFLQVLWDISLSVDEGEFVALIGPNGAGKSTLFAMLCGIQRADSGQIFLAGRDVTRMHAFQRARLGVGLTFQTNRAFHALSVQENLAIPRPPATSENDEAGESRLNFALEAFELDTADPTRAAELAHNQLQWLEIAMVLAGYPNLVLLDEPTAGMSAEETSKTAAVLKHLNSTGLTIVVVEHDMAFVKDVAQTVTVLHQGRVLAEGSVRDITDRDDVRDIYLGRK